MCYPGLTLLTHKLQNKLTFQKEQVVVRKEFKSWLFPLSHHFPDRGLSNDVDGSRGTYAGRPEQHTVLERHSSTWKTMCSHEAIGERQGYNASALDSVKQLLGSTQKQSVSMLVLDLYELGSTRSMHKMVKHITPSLRVTAEHAEGDMSSPQDCFWRNLLWMSSNCIRTAVKFPRRKALQGQLSSSARVQ